MAQFFGEAIGRNAPLEATSNLFEAGVSSLLAQLLAQLEQTYVVVIPIEKFIQQPTVPRLTQFLSAAQPAPAALLRIPDRPLLRQPYSTNRWLNYFLNNGLSWQQFALPYALGLRLRAPGWRNAGCKNTGQPLTLSSRIGLVKSASASYKKRFCAV